MTSLFHVGCASSWALCGSHCTLSVILTALETLNLFDPPSASPAVPCCFFLFSAVSPCPRPVKVSLVVHAHKSAACSVFFGACGLAALNSGTENTNYHRERCCSLRTMTLQLTLSCSLLCRRAHGQTSRGTHPAVLTAIAPVEDQQQQQEHSRMLQQGDLIKQSNPWVRASSGLLLTAAGAAKAIGHAAMQAPAS